MLLYPPALYLLDEIGHADVVQGFRVYEYGRIPLYNNTNFLLHSPRVLVVYEHGAENTAQSFHQKQRHLLNFPLTRPCHEKWISADLIGEMIKFLRRAQNST
jgi:hypothetical protein